MLALALVVGVQLSNSGPARGEPDAPIAAENLARPPGVVDPVPVTELSPQTTVETSDLDRRFDFWLSRAALHAQSEQERIYVGDLLDLKARLTGDVAH